MKFTKSVEIAQSIANELFAAPIGGKFKPHRNPIAKEFKFSKYEGYLIDASHFSFKLNGEEFKVIVENKCRPSKNSPRGRKLIKNKS